MTKTDIIKLYKSEEWQIKHSSLAKRWHGNFTYKQCRDYSCTSICSDLTHINPNKCIIEIPKGEEFHFIGRVDTEWCKHDPFTYYMAFKRRTFISFSTVCNKNISHYKNALFFVYDIYPEDIVHVFPMDSNTKVFAEGEEILTYFPSLWLTLKDLEDLTAKLGVYNQVTCRTKRKGKILKPIAVLAFGTITDEIMHVAKLFKVGIILVHPDDNAINYKEDLIACDYDTLQSVSNILYQEEGISVKEILSL